MQPFTVVVRVVDFRDRTLATFTGTARSATDAERVGAGYQARWNMRLPLYPDTGRAEGFYVHTDNGRLIAYA